MLNHRNRIASRLPKPASRFWCCGCDANRNGKEKCQFCGWEEGYYKMRRDIKDLEIEEYIKDNENESSSSN